MGYFPCRIVEEQNCQWQCDLLRASAQQKILAMKQYLEKLKSEMEYRGMVSVCDNSYM